MKTKMPFSFTYLGINNEQFAVFPEHYVPGKEQKLSFQVHYSTDPTQRAMSCEIIADFSSPEGNLFLRCAASCAFALEESYWESRKSANGKSVDLAPVVYSHFAAFTIGTLRGILHVRSVAARVAVILPPVNVNQLLGKLDMKPVELKA